MSYVEQARWESIAGYVLYRRLNDLESRSDVDLPTPARSAVDADVASCGRWSADDGLQAQSMYTELKGKLSNGSYVSHGD